MLMHLHRHAVETFWVLTAV